MESIANVKPSENLVYKVLSYTAKGVDQFFSSHHEFFLSLARSLGNLVTALVLSLGLYQAFLVYQENNAYHDRVGPVESLPAKKVPKVKKLATPEIYYNDFAPKL